MKPLHHKASYWIRKGLFDDLSSFGDFETRVNRLPEEKDRGDVFEIFIEGYLATQSITQRKRHWLVGHIPLQLRERYNLPRDATGIDGIYETHDGSQIAYQVKYRQRRQLTFAEVAPFLGLTEKFSERVVFTNATRLSHKAVARTRWVGGDVFRSLPEAALHAIEAWIKAKRVSRARITPDPRYQTQALADIKAALKSHDRANVVMACGTGKTLVALWAAEEQKPRTVLVLLPSLTLLQQTLREWCEQTAWGDRFSYICICSDRSVVGEDAMAADTTEMEFPVRTDPKIVRQFFQQKSRGVKVIFSTYQSSPIVGKGTKGLAPIDVAIFDEAHKTTGLSGSAFSFALSDKNIHIQKRLFLTATPRHIDIRHRNNEGEFRVSSMDDESIYGPRAHTLSFSRAVNLGIICRYKVLISLIDKVMVDDFTRKNGVTLVKNDEVAASWMANLIAVQRAIDSVEAQKIITFHSRVKLAREFAANEPRGISHYLKNFDVRHVNGAQSSADRGDTIRAFASSRKGLLTNARCLTEGVNIPAVDMVAFVDPRQSRIDITQAVGRAMRKPRGKSKKTVGYVVVPLFAGMGKNDSLDDAIKSEKFEAVVDVLNALQEHDEELTTIIREIKQRHGEGELFNLTALTDKVEIIGPRVGLERLAESIDIQIVDRLGSSWDEYFGLLIKYRRREGDCLVPAKHIEGNVRLGSWVDKQRQKCTGLSPERRKRLDSIGFVWDVRNGDWENAYLLLERYVKKHGSAAPPSEYVIDGFRLGRWVVSQRLRGRRGTLSPSQSTRLNAIGFIWNVDDENWDRHFSALKRFASEKGHCRVPQRSTFNGLKLGQWVRVQREKLKDDRSSDRHKQLSTIGFSWDPFSEAWEDGYCHLTAFVKEHGHSIVPHGHRRGDFNLFSWVDKQRQSYTKGDLSADREKRLRDLGFVFNKRSHQWDTAFSALVRFKKRTGHTEVPYKHTESNVDLGSWVQKQRADMARMPQERREALDRLGFEWNSRRDARWEEHFSALEKYVRKYSNCLVNFEYRVGKLKLGAWVVLQRQTQKKGSMPEERKRRLDSLGFVWKARTGPH